MDKTANCLNGELKAGDLVLSIPEDDYPCLVGTVLSVSGTDDWDKDYIYVNFMHPDYTQNRLKEIEQMLCEAYGRPTTPGIWPLDIDNLPMSADSLIRITGIGKILEDAILDSEKATESLCRLIQDSPAVKERAQSIEPLPEYVSEKLYSPLEFYLRDKEDAENGVYDEIDYWRDELFHEEAFSYRDNIEAALSRDRKGYDNGRGLAEYLHSETLAKKVYSLIPSIELHCDGLYCVADIKLSEPLISQEISELKDWWSGQLSDGWGEGFSQREIKVDRGELYVETWTPEDSFFIDTERGFKARLGIDAPENKHVHVDSPCKPSVLGQIRDAGSLPKKPPKDKQPHTKDGPEL